MKVCAGCRAAKGSGEFAICKRSKGGHKACCKDCVNTKQQLSREKPDEYRLLIQAQQDNHVAEQLAKMNNATRSRCHHVEFEKSAIGVLKEAHRCHGMELVVWQDSTTSDFGDRPIDCAVDLWLPAQVKTTCRTEPPLFFKGADGYAIDVLCIDGNGLIYAFDHEFMRKNQSALSVGKNIEIGRSSASKTHVFNEIKPVDAVLLSQQRCAKWHAEYAKHLEGCDSLLLPEYALRMQCPPCVKMEVFTMTIFKVFRSEYTFEWNGPNNCVDALVGGERAQFKVAGWNRRLRNSTFIGQCHKKIGTTVIPYAVGDVDLFVFSTVHVRLGLYLEWMIPAAVMDVDYGTLAHRTDGVFTTTGRMSVTLSVVGPCDENMNLQMQIFGRLPRSDVDRSTSRFLRVMKLSDEVQIPECMHGRDPECVQ